MTGRRGRPASRRQRKIRASLVATFVGLAVLMAIAFWIEAGRETDLADPTAGITATFKDSAGEHPPIRFRNVAASVGVTMRHGPGPRGRALPEDTGSGLAWGDYDGDGDWDLYAVSFAGPLGAPADERGSNRLFRNDDGRFTDVTPEAGVGDLEGFGMGASFADYDADGDLDLYVTNYGPNRLYRNRGDGTFEDVAARAGVDDAAWSCGVAWGDYDRDGLVDLYVCNYVAYEHDPHLGDVDVDVGEVSIPFALNPNAFDPVRNRLYKNRGDGTFEDVSESAGVENPDGRSLAATLCDLDGDGWLDLYVNNDVSPNRFYRNLGGDEGAAWSGRFEDVSLGTGTGDPRGSMGLSVADVALPDVKGGEPDGLPELFITHWVAQENALYQSLRLPSGRIEYRDRTRRYRLGEVSIETVGWGSCFVDFDLDGLLDVAVANGSTLESKEDRSRLRAEPLFFFWNDGRQFVEFARTAGEACAGLYGARGLAAADYDGDGDVDLAVAVNRGSPLLLRNDTETSHRSLSVTLVGPAAALFGSKVQLAVGDRQQTRWYGADVSYLSMHAPELVFGVGAADGADRLTVTWADGAETRLEDVPAGRVRIEHE